MGKHFFGGWELWEKLLFVLGCGIVVTLCLGGAKVAHTHYRLRKHSLVAEGERREQAQRREMLQKSSTPDSERTEEIPFGVRAIERGVEVEGVYISRPNTPESAACNGSNTSSLWKFSPKNGPLSDLEKQTSLSRLSYQDRAISDSNLNRARPTSSAFEQAVSAERLPSIRNSRESIPTLPLEKPAKSRCPPPSFAKYSGNPSLYRHSSSTNTLEGFEAIHRASTSLRPDTHFDPGSGESYTQSSSGSSDSGPIASAAPNLLNQEVQTAPTPRVRHYSIDFEMLNSRRMSQAAETGQLMPCVKKPAMVAELQGCTPIGFPRKDEKSGYFPVIKPTQSTHGSADVGSPSLPKIEALPAAVRRSSMPEGVTPFAQFVQTAPLSPRPASLKSVDGGEKQRPVSEMPSVYTSASSSPTNPVAAQTSNKPVRRSLEKERPSSQVIRGAGSGFEILKPGSLHPVMPTEQPEEKQRTVPPVSLHNYRRSRSRSSSTSRKLQKKRRPSVESHSSSESGKRTSVFELQGSAVSL